MCITKSTLNDFLMITLGTAICSAGVYFMLIPSHLSIGSISGLAIILSNMIPLPISLITFILNVGLLLVGFLLIGRDFGAKTVYTSVLLPVLLAIFERFFPITPSLTGDIFSDMICYLFIVSVGQAILFTRNASSGGLDIVGKLLNKFFRMELGKAVALAGMCVAVSSVFLYDIKTVALSVLGTYLGGLVLDHFIFGFDQKRRVCILSKNMEQVREYIINTMHSGATIYEAIGAYDHVPHKEIVVIVNKAEYVQLMAYLEKTDPAAFITVYAVSSVSYQPKPRG
jgi:uncharacterized membrane-anchored protein YitT (DUF2179 family)